MTFTNGYGDPRFVESFPPRSLLALLTHFRQQLGLSGLCTRCSCFKTRSDGLLCYTLPWTGRARAGVGSWGGVRGVGVGGGQGMEGIFIL